MRIFWGSVILLIGLYFLGQNLNWWPSVNLSDLIQFWPILLILFGFSLIARSWHLGWLITLVFFILLIGLTYFLFFSPKSKIKLTNNIQTNQFNVSEDLLPTIQKMNFKLETGAIDLNISKENDKLFNLEMKSDFTKPEVETKINDGVAEVITKTLNTSNLKLGTKNNLKIDLTDKIPIHFKIDSGASKMNLDFSKLRLSGLDINTGASDLIIRLGNVEPETKITVNAGASNINIKLPENIGARIVTRTGLSNKTFNGFKQIDNETYQSNNYDNAPSKVSIELKAGVSSLNVSY